MISDERLATFEEREWGINAIETAALVAALRVEREANEKLRVQLSDARSRVQNRDAVAAAFDGEEAPKVLLDTLEALRAEQAAAFQLVYDMSLLESELAGERENLAREREVSSQLRAALRELAIAFTPKIVPLDVDENGGYEEATTRWGGHPAYESALETLAVASYPLNPGPNEVEGWVDPETLCDADD